MKFLYIALIVIFDQITKFAAKNILKPVSNIDLIPGYFSLSYVENRGAAFGIFRGNKILLIGLTSLVTIFILYYIITNKNLNKYFKLSLIFIAAGAIGNLIDRITLGYVVDFFHFYIKNIFDWPVFNIADMSVVCGTILLVLNIIFVKE
jgi:signal peptidase II